MDAGDYRKSEVPVGRSGAWSVDRFGVCEGRPGDPRPEWCRPRAGSYTRLRRGNEVFMTDLFEEWWTQRSGIEEARRRGGEVLVTGLGLGMVVESVLRAPASTVERVSVVERSADVIRLVGPYLEGRWGGRLRIIHADAFTWEPQSDASFTVGWHDIWPSPYGVAVEEQVERLERRFRSCCDWQGSWPRACLALGVESCP